MNTTCLAVVDPSTQRTSVRIGITSGLFLDKIYPISIKFTNPLSIDVSSATFELALLAPGIVNTALYQRTVKSYALKLFSNVQLFTAQRQRSETCLQATECGTDPLSFQDQVVVGVRFEAFAPIGLGGKMEIEVPRYFGWLPDTSCAGWNRPLPMIIGNTTKVVSSMWTPWLKRDLQCRVEYSGREGENRERRKLVLEFKEPTQGYLDTKNEYRLEMTATFPAGVLVPTTEENRWWIDGFAKSTDTTPLLSARVDGFQLSDRVVDWSVTPTAPLGDDGFPLEPFSMKGDPAFLGGFSIEVRFSLNLQDKLKTDDALLIYAPQGYDLREVCSSLKFVNRISNRWQVPENRPFNLEFNATCTADKMLLRRLGPSWQAAWPLAFKGTSSNPEMPKTWNEVDEFWQLHAIGARTTTTTGAPILDCVGGWTDWTSCAIGGGAADTGVQSRTFYITREASPDGGLSCSFLNGSLDQEPCEEEEGNKLFVRGLVNEYDFSAGPWTRPGQCKGAFGEWSLCSEGRESAKYGIVFENTTSGAIGCPFSQNQEISRSCGRNCVGGWQKWETCSAPPLCFFKVGWVRLPQVPGSPPVVADSPYYLVELTSRAYHEFFYQGAMTPIEVPASPGYPVTDTKLGWSRGACPASATQAAVYISNGQTNVVAAPGIGLSGTRGRIYRVRDQAVESGKCCALPEGAQQFEACSIQYQSPTRASFGESVSVLHHQCTCALGHCGSYYSWGPSPGGCGILQAGTARTWAFTPQFQAPVVRLTGEKRGAGVKTKLEFEFSALSKADTLYLFSTPRLRFEDISFAEVETVDSTGKRRISARNPGAFVDALVYP